MPGSLLGSRDFYDAIGDTYTRETEARRPYLDAIDAIVVDRAIAAGARTLLDVGCGDGSRLSRIVDRTGIRAVGIDSSPRMVAAARAAGLEAHVVDIADPGPAWPMEGRRFDLVTALWNVVGHVGGPADRRRALVTMRGSLHDGGQLILDVNNRYNAAAYGWRAAVRNRVTDMLRRGPKGDFVMRRTVDGRDVETVTHIFSPAEIEALIGEAGLTLTETRFIDYADGADRGPWSGQLCLIARPSVAPAQSSSRAGWSAAP
jgi:SAM-dependent methyltransferase